MAATYKRFLASPNSSFLADDATLHYVTTTTSFTGATQIIKHLNALQKQVKKKREDILTQIEAQNAIALEFNTGLEFQTSGGAYLPGLDDNFVSDRLAYLPITHFVYFTEGGKISQIRLSWDQGALLKQIDIIGKSGRNWPIIDNREQLKLIQSALKSVGPVQPSQDHNDNLNRTRGNSTNAFRDPHATLHMPVSREEIENTQSESIVSPYAGSRPQQRSFTDILGDEPADAGSPTANRQRNMSPAKRGQGQNHQPMRLYQEDHVEEEEETESRPTSSYIRPNPTKYNHFDFADGSDPQDAPKAGISFDEKPKTKKDSQWSFDDFTTPSKPKNSKTFRHQDIRHWDTDNETFAGQTPAVHGRGRRDAEANYVMQDDGVRSPGQERPEGRARGVGHNEGLGLYKNNLFNKDSPTPDDKRALGNITNVNARGTEPHFTMADDSPIGQQRHEKVSESRQKAVNNMGANWSNYDQSPQQKENSRRGQPQEHTRIHIAGNGMGANKNATSEYHKDQGINIAGDGMGGRSGTERNWLYGADGEEELPKPTNTRKPQAGSQQKTGPGNHWDF